MTEKNHHQAPFIVSYRNNMNQNLDEKISCFKNKNATGFLNLVSSVCRKTSVGKNEQLTFGTITINEKRHSKRCTRLTIITRAMLFCMENEGVKGCFPVEQCGSRIGFFGFYLHGASKTSVKMVGMRRFLFIQVLFSSSKLTQYNWTGSRDPEELSPLSRLRSQERVWFRSDESTLVFRQVKAGDTRAARRH